MLDHSGSKKTNLVFLISLSLALSVLLSLSSFTGAAIDDGDLYEYFLTPPESNETGNTTEPVIELLGDSITDCWDAGADPHPICSCDDLNNTRTQLSWDYELQNDIDFSLCDAYYTTGTGWEPVGTYTGNFNGAGHRISNLYINRPGVNVALFSYISGCSITDLGLIDVDITGAYAAPFVYNHNGVLNRSFATGSLTGTSGLGGLIVNNLFGNSYVNNSYSIINLSTSVSAWNNAGLVTWTDGGAIENSYAVPTFLDATGYGVVGMREDGNEKVANCFWDTEVSGTSSSDGVLEKQQLR